MLQLICPRHKSSLQYLSDEALYCCPSGCRFPIINEIPRFVRIDNYAASFGVQWNEYRTTQLDSRTGLTISRDRLIRMLGGSLDVVKGKNILEAGCGAGRFSEILLSAGGNLNAIDLSSAVEANYDNCGSFKNYSVCQANILELPFEPKQFDIVLCIGVIQHTPNPEQTIEALCDQVKPGGLLVIDHYTYGYPSTFSRRLLRNLLINSPVGIAMTFCRSLTSLLWPLHRLLWKLRKWPLIGRIRASLLLVSPLVDYHDAYFQLGPELLKAWTALDTHDTLTDRYKHLRGADEIRKHLYYCGMIDIEAYYAGNGVEARARKPIDEEHPGQSCQA